MSFLSNLFAKQEEPLSNFNWIPLTDISQLDEITNNSTNKIQAIFKHSTRCGISAMVIKQFEKQHNEYDSEIDFYFLDLLRFRAISNIIATKLNVHHQSPQLIILKNNKVVAHDSHHGILSVKLN